MATISAPSRSASSTPSVVLPEPVGPVRMSESRNAAMDMGTAEGGRGMPVFEHVTALACPPARLFDFLARPANLVQVWPPELHAKVTDASERFTLGSRFTVRVRRFGIPQSITSEITAFEDGVGFTDAQV